jgi:hypothetical protein
MQKTLSIEPIYQPCWISYLGSVSGILKALGKEEHDIINTGGYSGYAFALPNVLKGITCPSGPTSLGKMWSEVLKGTDILGYETKVYEDNQSFPTREDRITDEDRKRVIELFRTVQKAIDNENPVVLWGIPVPEYGIVTGYQENNYLVSTFRRLSDQPETPIAYDALQAPGCLHAIIFGNQTDEISEQDDKNALERAIALAEGDLTEENYIAGPEAYEDWADVLEKGASKDIIYHGNAYLNQCTLEAKEIATTFLKRLASKYEKFSSILLESADEYSKIVELLTAFGEIFPFAFEGDLGKEKRQKGAELLRSAVPFEKKALSLLKDAFNNWD